MHRSKVDGAATATSGGTRVALSAAQSGNGFLAGIGYEGSIDKGMAWTVGITYYDSLGGLDEADATFVNVGLKF